MRLKITLAAALSALLLTAIAAQAGPINIAVYRFQSQGEVNAFYKVKGAKCAKKWRKRNTLGVFVRKGTNACGFRSSVVADSQDPRPDQEMAAAVNLAMATPAAMRKRIYLGLAVRESKTASYEFRLLPAARRWQVWRDPRGSARRTLLKVGGGRFIRGPGARNNILLRAFDYGGSATFLLAKVNGRRVFSARDTNANQPNGRRTVVTIGSKAKKSANRAVGAFDNVAIRVPNPF
jgi:hypothetical protein